jgi:hypothetical protein
MIDLREPEGVVLTSYRVRQQVVGASHEMTRRLAFADVLAEHRQQP